MRRAWIIALAVSLGVLQVHFALAVVSAPAQEHAEHGYALLAQARLEAESTRRERLLPRRLRPSSSVSERAHCAYHPGACAAWRSSGGAARAAPTTGVSVPMASHTAATRRKNLQQALFLQPDNAAATFLLGLILATSRPGLRTAAGRPRTQPALSHKPRAWASPYVSPLRLSGKTAQSHCSRRGYRCGIALCRCPRRWQDG